MIFFSISIVERGEQVEVSGVGQARVFLRRNTRD